MRLIPDCQTRLVARRAMTKPDHTEQGARMMLPFFFDYGAVTRILLMTGIGIVAVVLLLSI
jgi:hypothetical protein